MVVTENYLSIIPTVIEVIMVVSFIISPILLITGAILYFLGKKCKQKPWLRDIGITVIVLTILIDISLFLLNVMQDSALKPE